MRSVAHSQRDRCSCWASPVTSPLRFPATYRRFVDQFNHGQYWTSHETLEDAWRGSRSEFYHGLILVASAFVHLERENAHGVSAQINKAIAALRPYGPEYLGMDVRGLLLHLEAVRSAVRQPQADAGWVSGIRPPVLELHEGWVRGSEPELDVG